MKKTVLSIENLSKKYTLGLINNQTLYQDLNDYWYKIRKKKHTIKSKSEIWALKNINLKINQGDIVGLIGSNGAGKSTLLKILSRITSPTNGLVKVKGRIASLLEVGTGFHPDLTGKENIFLNGAIMGMTRQEIKSKINQIISFANIEKFVDTPVKRYSSGMYVRLAFAVAAHLDTEILLVDEVLAVGDLAFQEKCIGKMSNISKNGRTIIFVSHNLQSIKSLCTKAVWIDDGEIKYNGNTEKAVEKYRNSTTQDLLIDLNKINRSGSARIKVKSIKFYGKENDTDSNIFSGQDFYCLLKFEYEKNININDLEVFIHVSDENNYRIFTISNVFNKTKFNSIKEGVKCHIPNIPVIPGKYNLTISIRLRSESTDKFNYPGKLIIMENNELSSLQAQNKSWGSIIIKDNWSSIN